MTQHWSGKLLGRLPVLQLGCPLPNEAIGGLVLILSAKMKASWKWTSVTQCMKFRVNCFSNSFWNGWPGLQIFVSFKRTYVVVRHHPGWPKQILVGHQRKKKGWKLYPLKITNLLLLCNWFAFLLLIIVNINPFMCRTIGKIHRFWHCYTFLIISHQL